MPSRYDPPSISGLRASAPAGPWPIPPPPALRQRRVVPVQPSGSRPVQAQQQQPAQSPGEVVRARRAAPVIRLFHPQAGAVVEGGEGGAGGGAELVGLAEVVVPVPEQVEAAEEPAAPVPPLPVLHVAVRIVGEQ